MRVDDERLSELQHAYRLFYGDLNLCGCGSPEDAFMLIFRILTSTPRGGGTDAFNGSRYHWLGDGPLVNGAVHLILGQLTNAGLLEHGGVVDGSWLTPKGAYYRAVLGKLTWDAVDDTGMPHDDDECTESCWVLSEVQHRREPGPIKPDTGSVYEPIGEPPGTSLTQEMLDRAFESMIRPPYSLIGSAAAIPDTVPAEWATPLREPEDRLPRGRNPYIGCREIGGTWIHGRPHDCPVAVRGF